MISTTGTTIESYIAWLRNELESKSWGEVAIRLTICNGQVTDVRRESIETEHIPMAPRKAIRIA